MRYVETVGTLASAPIIIQGVLDDAGEVEAVRVMGLDGTPDSWAYSDKQTVQFAALLKAAQEARERVLKEGLA